MSGSGVVPFTILTGFLGAGKTTVLNRMLNNPGGRRIAVLVNELGRVAIDGRRILSQGGDVLELAGGCVCCKVDVKNDLWDGIADVIARACPDNVVLETTGIAEPDAICRGVRKLAEDGSAAVEVAGVVCVVDAEAGVAMMERREEAVEQVRASDRLLLSKLDLADAAQLRSTHERLSQLNPDAERAGFPSGSHGDSLLTPWLLEPRLLRERGTRVHAHRQGQLMTVSISSAWPLVPELLLEVLERHRDRLLRAKGEIWLVGDDRRGVLDLSGSRLTLCAGERWRPGGERTELVLIGEALDEALLRRQIWACQAEASARPVRS